MPLITQKVTVQKNVPATMRDGTTLMANVYRPGGEAAVGSYPVLLTRLPYGKDIPSYTAFLDPVRAAQHGYIVIVQDVRGRFASEGEFSPFIHEFEDGHDTVEWAAKLSGSNGSVGMFGLSYYGKTQWQAAVTQPPSLKSMVPGITWGNHLNGVQMRGGAQELGIMNHWAHTAIAPDILFRRYRQDPGQLAQKLPALVGVIDTIQAGGGYDILPLTDIPDPDDLVPFMRGGFESRVDDKVWAYVNIDGRYDEIEASTLHIGGWYDVFLGETLRQYEAMKQVAQRKGMRPPRLLVGPWTHGDFGSTFGDLDFGIGSSGIFLNYRGDLTDYHLRWFDATLKGDEEALADRPPVEVFVMGENRWRGYEEWPPPGSREEHWYFGSGGNANTRSGDGTLAREKPDPQAHDEYDYDPQNPMPTLGGAILMPQVYRAGARDQGSNEDRPDVLCYTSEPLGEDYTVLGAVHVTLFAASSAPDTDFVARLVDVHPDGRAIGITDGIIRASARESYPAPGVVSPVEPSPIKPDEVYEYAIDLWATGNTFKAGHRIRVEVTSSCFPRWDRNLNTGESGAHSSRAAVARQRIFHDPEHPSRITLTVVEN